MSKKKTVHSISAALKGLFIPQKATRTETFEEALERMPLKETDLNARCKEFIFLTAFFLLVAIAILTYACWLVGHQHYKAFAVATAVSFVAIAQAIRYHFWLFQIKQRRLGCSLKEWFYHGFLGLK